MKIGFIGTGNMGTVLIQSLLESGAVKATDINITNRTLAKAEKLAAAYPGVTVKDSSRALAQQSQLIFLCAKPHEMYPILEDIVPFLTQENCVVSITSPISLKQLESVVPCSCARFIPSITNRAHSGASLLTFGKSCTKEWYHRLNELAARISLPLEIQNEYTRVASDIVSCGPAFFSYLAQAFIEGAVDHTGIDKEDATKLTERMLIGLGELLRQGHYSLPTLQEKVCVKGGITGEGIKVMENELGEVFRHLFEATHRKFKKDIQEQGEQFGLSYY